MQPAHLLTDIPLVDRHWGGRGRGAYSFRSLLERGTALVFGSDVPVASIDPREGVFAALDRTASPTARRRWRPEERLGFNDVLRAYTAGAASAGGHAAPAGHARAGMDADSWPGRWTRRRSGGTALPSARAGPTLTVVGGEIVMRR